MKPEMSVLGIDTYSPYGDKSAVRCPPYGGDDGSAPGGQVAQEEVGGDGSSRVYTGHRVACPSHLQTVGVLWSAGVVP